jgi:hypothetical protein
MKVVETMTWRLLIFTSSPCVATEKQNMQKGDFTLLGIARKVDQHVFFLVVLTPCKSYLHNTIGVNLVD